MTGMAAGGAALAHYTMSYNGVGQLTFESISDASFEWAPQVTKAVDFHEANGLNQYKSINGTNMDYDGLNGDGTPFNE